MDPSHLAKMFMDYMNDDTDEEFVRLYFESQAQEEVASSKRTKHQRRNVPRNHEEGHFSVTPIYKDEQLVEGVKCINTCFFLLYC